MESWTSQNETQTKTTNETFQVVPKNQAINEVTESHILNTTQCAPKGMKAPQEVRTDEDSRFM
jgi:hypothetical protein